MSKLSELEKNLKWNQMPSENTKSLVREIIESIRTLFADNKALKEGVSRDVSPKANIRRPGGDIGKIEDEETKKAIMQLWDYRIELLDEQTALLQNKTSIEK